MGKSQSEYRREAFEAQAELCRELSDEALLAIDAMLATHDHAREDALLALQEQSDPWFETHEETT